jgi:hypothetical protein
MEPAESKEPEPQDLERARLGTFLGSIQESPAQRSPEWYELRKTTIGGSEVATIMGMNPYNNVRQLIGGKFGVNKFHGNIYTRWGNLFEHVTEKWAEVLMPIPDGIKEAGSIEGKIPGQRYSPDGLGVVNLNGEWYVILFEFKAPFSTLPNKKIPKHYRCQIQTGLMTIDVADFAVYISNSYRKCSLKDFQWDSEYDRQFHGGDWKKRKYGLSRETVLGCGLIFFSQTREHYDALQAALDYSDSEDEYDFADAFKAPDEKAQADFEPDDLDIIGDKETLQDIGAFEYSKMARILELYDEKRLQPAYFPVLANNVGVNQMEFIQDCGLERDERKRVHLGKYVKNCIKRFQARCKRLKLIPVGFLPYKILRSDVIIDPPDPTWEEQVTPKINAVMKELREIAGAPNPLEQYYELYPQVDAETASDAVSAGSMMAALGAALQQNADDDCIDE